MQGHTPAPSETRHRRSRLTAAFALTVAGVLALSACSNAGSATTATSEPSADQTLAIGLSFEPAAITSTGDLNNAQNIVFGLIHRGLTKYDTDGSVVNALAETIETDDNKTYTVTLRDGLAFSDGSPLTSANVKNSLLHWGDPAVAAHSYTGMKQIASIETPDDLTAVITLSAVDTSFEQYLADTAAAILPDEALVAGSDALVGAGPFSLENWDQGLSMTLVRNDEFYAADEVTLEEIDVTFIADSAARINALSSGSVDWIDSVPWESFDSISDGAGVVLDAQTSMFQYLMFNVEQSGPLQNPLVREAIAHAINRENTVEAGFYGHGEALAGIQGAGEKGEKLWDFDPAKARDLLAEAGYPDGFSISLLGISGNFYQDMATSIQADLKEIGIDVTLDLPEVSSWSNKIYEGDYQLAINGTYAVVEDPLVYLSSLVVGGPKSNGRSLGYNNDELNSVLAAGQAATDPAERQDYLDQALAIIQTDVPLATFNLREVGFAHVDKLQGFATLPRVAPFSSYSLEQAYLVD
jgi:ABC-type transport system substrate-binding protein